MTTSNLQQQQRFPGHEEQIGEAESSQGSGALRNEMNVSGPDLFKHARDGDWDAIKNYLSRYPDGFKTKIQPHGGTVLHVAAFAGNPKVMEEVVNSMSETELEIKDDFGRTALSCAAMVGIKKMAECMVSKNKDLVTVVNKDKRIPLVEACIRNHKDMARYLYDVTPDKFLCDEDNGIHGSLFLQCAIGAQILDIAYGFLSSHPNMTTTKDDVWKSNPLISLSNMPEIFKSGNRLALWQQWIYSCISTQPIASVGDNFCICIPDQCLSGSNTLQVLSKLPGLAINLLPFLGIKQIYESKRIHIYSDKILQCMWEHVSKLDFEVLLEAKIEQVFHNASKNSIDELAFEVIKGCNHLKDSKAANFILKTLILSLIENRHENVFSLLCEHETSRVTCGSLLDESGNTMFNLAAKLPPPSQLARISGAALQMQRELQWYKEVESMMNPIYKKFCYENNLTARELFTNEHKGLLVKGEQWMKQAATSCTVVGALIITIMFTAVFTVPGGNVQETGYPIFKDKKFFTVFIVADAISLFSSSISVLMFLGILTSRYAEEDFLKSLPTKLILGLSTLFLSIAAMMVTFCAALIIMLNGRLEIIIPVVLLASIPVTFFIFLQFPLLVEIYGSTYGQGIANKKMKRWY